MMLSTIAQSRPEAAEHLAYYGKYIELVPAGDVLEALERQRVDTQSFLADIADDVASICHPPYTWTIKEVIGHLIDGERVFGYRAYRFARADATPLAGFDEQAYVKSGNFTARKLTDLAKEFDLVRRGNLCMFRSWSEDAWHRGGKANNDFI